MPKLSSGYEYTEKQVVHFEELEKLLGRMGPVLDAAEELDSMIYDRVDALLDELGTKEPILNLYMRNAFEANYMTIMNDLNNMRLLIERRLNEIAKLED